MAIRKKSNAKAPAAAKRAAIAIDPPDVAIIVDTPDVVLAVDPDVDPDDGGAADDSAVLSPDNARLKAATQQLGVVFDSIEKRATEALDRRQAAIQATIALTEDKNFTAIVKKRDATKLARLSEAAADSTTRLAAATEERKVLVETMAGARQTMGVKRPKRRPVGK
jgi:hypothetical protein